MPSRFLRRFPLVSRLVLSVVVVMAAVCVAGGVLIFWRVDSSLTSQLDQDARAYRDVGLTALASGDPIPQLGRFRYQIWDDAGHLLRGNLAPRVFDREAALRVVAEGPQSGESGGLFDSLPDYVWSAVPAVDRGKPVVAVFAINRDDHDQALRNLLLELLIGAGITLVVASWLGYRTTRAALRPVERYRQTAQNADATTRLPVGPDNDELARLGHTFNALLDRVEDLRQRERRFLADASHELRAPLSVMRAEVDVALAGEHNDDHDHGVALRSLSEQITRLERLCNALLQLEEVQGVDPRHAGTEVDLGALIVTIVEQARKMPEASDRAITTAVEGSVTLIGHAYWLDVALTNLVVNALRHGRGTVEIGARSHARGDLEVWVRDDGPGLSPDFIPRAWERFARDDESRASGGAGLGLPIVAEVAALHHGSVTIDGSRVAMWFSPIDAGGR